MLHRIFLITFFSCLFFLSIAQPFYPEQDCIGAIPICGTSIHVSTAYEGLGLIEDIGGITCLANAENNSAWYKLQIKQGGQLEFTLIGDSTIDLDYVLYDITNANCGDIRNAFIQPIRCNYAFGLDSTGLKNGYFGNTAGPTGQTFLAPVNATAGKTYLLCVDIFDNVGAYTIDFSESDAIIVPSQPIVIQAVRMIEQNDSTVSVKISMLSNCGVLNNPENFFVADSSYNIISMGKKFQNCGFNTYFDLVLQTPVNVEIAKYLITEFDSAFTSCLNNNIGLERDTIPISRLTTGIDNANYNNEISGILFNIYPNPSQNILNIETHQNITEPLNIEILDIAGAKIFQTTMDITRKQLNIGHLANGYYFLRVSSNEKAAVFKFAVAR